MGALAPLMQNAAGNATVAQPYQPGVYMNNYAAGLGKQPVSIPQVGGGGGGNIPMPSTSNPSNLGPSPTSGLGDALNTNTMNSTAMANNPYGLSLFDTSSADAAGGGGLADFAAM